MTLFKSLIYREYKLTRKRCLLMLILLVLLMLFLMLPLLLDPEYLNDATPEEVKGIVAMFCALPAVTGAIMAGTDNGLHKADINTGWKRYAYVLPPTATQRTLSSLILKLVTVLIFGVLSVLYSVWIGMISGYHYTLFTLIIYIITSDIMLVYDLTYNYFMMFAKEKRDVKKYAVIATVLGLGILYFFSSSLQDFLGVTSEKPDGSEVSIAMEKAADFISTYPKLAAAAAAFAVLCAAYFFFMRRAYERREP